MIDVLPTCKGKSTQILIWVVSTGNGVVINTLLATFTSWYTSGNIVLEVNFHFNSTSNSEFTEIVFLLGAVGEKSSRTDQVKFVQDCL